VGGGAKGNVEVGREVGFRERRWEDGRRNGGDGGGKEIGFYTETATNVLWGNLVKVWSDME